jgi:hypothetical protein
MMPSMSHRSEQSESAEPNVSALERLTRGIESPAQREILVECLAGKIPPATALAQLHQETGDASVMRAIIDDVTKRAASLSRATDSLLRDRVDDLTQLVVESEPESERAD